MLSSRAPLRTQVRPTTPTTSRVDSANRRVISATWRTVCVWGGEPCDGDDATRAVISGWAPARGEPRGMGRRCRGHTCGHPCCQRDEEGHRRLCGGSRGHSGDDGGRINGSGSKRERVASEAAAGSGGGDGPRGEEGSAGG